MSASGEHVSRPPDWRARERILAGLDETMLVEAAAGTGKTTSMVGRMVALISAGRCRIDKLAAVTFTRKAAAELRERFQYRLERAAGESEGEEGVRLKEALAGVERCFIGTIHSFCGRLLRERPLEAGVDIDFREIDDDENFRLKEEAWKRYGAALYAGRPEVHQKLRDLGLEIEQLRESFYTFADYPDVRDWPVEKVEIGSFEAAREALVEYAGHMEGLLGTFPDARGNDKLMDAYGLVVRLVRYRDLSRAASLMEVLEVFDGEKKAVQKMWPGGKGQGKEESARWETFAGDTARPLLRRWREKRYEAIMPLLKEAAAEFDRFRREKGALNFQDLLLQSASLLRDKPAVRSYFRRRFTHLLVDEFQDTDPVQAEIVLYLTADDRRETDWRKCRPVAGSLFVVGDPKQSIYRFRRADIVTYSKVKHIIEASGGVVLSLTTNFRTAADLVDWGNRTFQRSFPEKATMYSPAAVPMNAGRLGPEGDLRGLKTLGIPDGCCKNAEAVTFEADMIARFIRRSLDEKLTVSRTDREIEEGKTSEAVPGDFMIVTWRKKNLDRYGMALRKMGIPYQVSGGGSLAEVEELRFLADLLKAVIEPENPVALAAILRGELFGFSDGELYAFRSAGGEFNWHAAIPEGLGAELEERFHRLYESLRRYDRWLKRLPPVAALEGIASDLGLTARALCGAGGGMSAGSIGKAFQMLRAVGGEFFTPHDMAIRLEGFLEREAEFEGLPARAYTSPVVRLMNLHKVKGLEAPVVFLADTTGRNTFRIKHSIDRSGDSITGFLAIYGEKRGHSQPLLAHPPRWDHYRGEEGRFDESEKKRLLYVAATRAGAMLVLPVKGKRSKSSYWEYFAADIEEASPLEDPGERSAPALESVEVPEGTAVEASRASARRWEIVRRPTYAVEVASDTAISPAELHRSAGGARHGTEWGTVMHFLLETAMKDPEVNLGNLAQAALREQGLEIALAGEALALVGAVRESELWKRAGKSEELLVEVPLEICSTDSEDGDFLPTVKRGVIDLVFKEPAGWVVVDYKTDVSAAKNWEKLVGKYRRQVEFYARLWSDATGLPVHETGLYFTAARQYVPIER